MSPFLGLMNGTFEIVPEMSPRNLTLNIKPLDYEMQPSYVINISATNVDTGKSTMISVAVEVEDVNEYALRFTRR